MKRYVVLVAIIVMVQSLRGISAADLPTARVKVRVTDETGRPLSNVSVTLAGVISPNASRGKVRKDATDVNGSFVAQLESNGSIHARAERSAFYRTEMSPAYTFENARGASEEAFKTGFWSPDPVAFNVMLKPITNPIAMYARRINRALPDQNESTGFDMFVGDFVAPYGRGENADITFQLEPADPAIGANRRRLKVIFRNPADGIVAFKPSARLQGSALRSPYNAPETGFLPNWTVTRSQSETSTSANYNPQKHGYFFRIRSHADASGKVVSSNYGKIYGDFMNFTYYLNPTPNDRNIEFDPKRNLFTDLKPDERVTEP